MKKMKKVLASLLAATMVMSMSFASFAAEVNTTSNQDLTSYLNQAPIVPKKYVINEGTAPAETFKFKFEGESYKNGDGKTVADATIPAIDDVEIPFDAISATAEKTVKATIDVSKYELGVYTYKVTEVKPTTKTSGVTYSEEELYLVLTILRDENSGKNYVAAMHYESATGTDKESGFKNEYNAGSLAVSKEITGNMADMSKKFDFTVVFTPETGTAFDTTVQIVNDNGTTAREYTEVVENGVITITFKLGDGETATFTNIPAGTIYTVDENEENYTTNKNEDSVWTNADKIIKAEDADTVTFTNELTNTVDTGIILDSAPYVLLLALAAVGMFAVVNKKREEEF